MNKVFTGKVIKGISTDAEVSALRRAFPPAALTEGRVIEHGEIEAVIAVKRGPLNGRYYAIVNRWKQRVRDEHCINIRNLSNLGYKVLSPEEGLTHGITLSVAARRKQTQAERTVVVVDEKRLSEPAKRARLAFLTYSHQLAGLFKGIRSLPVGQQQRNPQPMVPTGVASGENGVEK